MKNSDPSAPYQEMPFELHPEEVQLGRPMDSKVEAHLNVIDGISKVVPAFAKQVGHAAVEAISLVQPNKK